MSDDKINQDEEPKKRIQSGTMVSIRVPDETMRELEQIEDEHRQAAAKLMMPGLKVTRSNLVLSLIQRGIDHYRKQQDRRETTQERRTKEK
jgi:hypothetical protein